MKFIDFLPESEGSAEAWNWQGMNALAFASLTSSRLQATPRCTCSPRNRESSWTKCH